VHGVFDRDVVVLVHHVALWLRRLAGAAGAAARVRRAAQQLLRVRVVGAAEHHEQHADHDARDGPAAEPAAAAAAGGGRVVNSSVGVRHLSGLSIGQIGGAGVGSRVVQVVREIAVVDGAL
jgi:hypothetical protein